MEVRFCRGWRNYYQLRFQGCEQIHKRRMKYKTHALRNQRYYSHPLYHPFCASFSNLRKFNNLYEHGSFVLLAGGWCGGDIVVAVCGGSKGRGPAGAWIEGWEGERLRRGGGGGR